MKWIILLVLVGISLTTNAQKLIVTPSGLRDSLDNQKPYIVIEADSLTSQKLYNNAVKYISEKYKNPKEVIRSQIESEYLKFETFVSDFIVYNNSGINIPIQATYTTELKFKKGKVRYEIVALDMKAQSYNYKVLFSGGFLEGYIIYKNNGKLFKEKTKLDIENYFSKEISILVKYLKGESKTDDW